MYSKGSPSQDYRNLINWTLVCVRSLELVLEKTTAPSDCWEMCDVIEEYENIVSYATKNLHGIAAGLDPETNPKLAKADELAAKEAVDREMERIRAKRNVN